VQTDPPRVAASRGLARSVPILLETAALRQEEQHEAPGAGRSCQAEGGAFHRGRRAAEPRAVMAAVACARAVRLVVAGVAVG
jgi:hypothetical protein